MEVELINNRQENNSESANKMQNANPNINRFNLDHFIKVLKKEKPASQEINIIQSSPEIVPVSIKEEDPPCEKLSSSKKKRYVKLPLKFSPSKLLKIEYIDLINPEENYTIDTFDLTKAENKKLKNVARVRNNYYDEINLISPPPECEVALPSTKQKPEEICLSDSPITIVSEPDDFRVEACAVYTPHYTEEKCYIKWINNIDSVNLPKWKYVVECAAVDEKVSEYVKIAKMLNTTCDCEEKCSSHKECSCSLMNTVVNMNLSYSYDLPNRTRKYTNDYSKKLVASFKTNHHIFECSPMCECCKDKCHLSLINTIDRKLDPMSSFIIQRVKKTRNVNGKLIEKVMWGLFTTIDISKNSFVMEYCGEIITNREAEERGKLYDQEEISYLFDVSSDCSDDNLKIYKHYLRKFGRDITWFEKHLKKLKLDFQEDFPLVIDAKEYGNHARFINHSCNPNLMSVNVHKESKDPRFSSICLFAIQDIKAGSELTIDYFYDSFEGAQDVYCLCNETNCRNYLYSSK